MQSRGMAAGRALGIGAAIAGLAGLGILFFFWSDRFGVPADTRTPQQAVRERAEAFGLQMKQVSLLSPGVSTDLAAAYGSFVTPELLAQWQASPEDAPGRRTSSPYPDRLVIRGVAPSGEQYIVEGEIVLQSSAGEAGRERVTLVLENRNGAWLIREYMPEAGVQNLARFTVQMHERADLPGIGIEVTEVLEDSRCPSDVQCIQAGTVRVAAVLYTGMGDGAAPEEFELGQTVTTEAHAIRFIEVSPEPQAGEAIPDAAYEFVFEIRPHDPSGA